MNRLVSETSPYLLQHAGNPVEWQPWDEAAFRRAREGDKPLFISVGYSTCYWCHVMARESFEDRAVADLLNAHFVPVKVDREERPDVDEALMLATQLLTGRGGWPNSVWLTPDGRPWFAGTYFPQARFVALLGMLARAWRERRQLLVEQADEVAAAVARLGSLERFAAGAPIDDRVVAEFAAALGREFDAVRGGFGSAPKFPPHASLRFLGAWHERTAEPEALRIIVRTLDGMAAGGIRDHIGGGFHRYATDERWFLPHFEKMLYDNAQLLRAYIDAYALTGADRYRDVATEIAAWLDREMRDPRGGYFSALDSESGHEEGAFYVWTLAELMDELGPQDGQLAAEVYGVRPEGNYAEEATGQRRGGNVLCLPEPLAAVARRVRLELPELDRRLAGIRQRLLEARLRRMRPHLDDKILAGWNGLAIAALAYAGRRLAEPRYIARAVGAAEFVHREMCRDGLLLHSHCRGVSKIAAYLADYAYWSQSLLELHAATGDRRWLDVARGAAEAMLAEYRDPADGGFFTTSKAHHDGILHRTKEIVAGGNMPSANAAAADALWRLGELTGELRYCAYARETLDAFAGLIRQALHGVEDFLTLYLHISAEAAATAGARQEAPAVAGSGTELAPAAAGGQWPVYAELCALAPAALAPGASLQARVRLRIEAGWHIYAPGAVPTAAAAVRVELEPNAWFELEQLLYPAGEVMDGGGTVEPPRVYAGQVDIVLTLRQKAGAGAAASPELRVRVRCQPCGDQRCLAPRVYRLALSLAIA